MMEEARNKNLVVVGPGQRLEDLAAAMGGIFARISGEGARLVAIEDLAQLLLLRADSGRLILDVDRIPGEDIGILRRFLEGREGWTMALVGDDEARAREAGLLDLGSTSFVTWPPNLEDLKALAGAGRSPRSARRGEGLEDMDPADLEPVPRAPSSTGEWDLSGLLDDLIVGRAVAKGAAQYHFQPPGELMLNCDRTDVSQVLDGFLGLAAACAGADQKVEVKARPEEELAVIELVFPPGALTDGDLPTLLEETPSQGPQELLDAAEVARNAQEICSLELAGTTLLSPARPGRLLLEVKIPLA